MADKKLVLGVVGAGTIAGVFLMARRNTKAASTALKVFHPKTRAPAAPPLLRKTVPPLPPPSPRKTTPPFIQRPPVGAGVQISKNFNTTEFLISKLAPELKRYKIPAEHFDNLKLLVNKVLQPARNKFGPLLITDGYRPTAFRNSKGKTIKQLLREANYKPANDSDHDYAQAAGIYPKVIANTIPLWGWLKANPYVRQAIMYFKTTPQGVKLSQIHVAVATKKRPIIKGVNRWFYMLDGKRIETLPM